MLADGTQLVLTKVAPTIAPLSAGQWLAGCQMTGINSLRQRIWQYTVWQEFWSNGSYITYLPAPSSSSDSWLGWTGGNTGAGPTNWWLSYPYSAAARGTYTFTYININGVPGASTSGWVQVNVNYTGTWTCSGA